ncbi:MAG: TIGR03618 family F420-dependent PPOX class oxidoreductase [Ilumatobacteraceae bacterium]|jgi:PPOX class probable F420-dependent enzyme
MSQSQGVVRLSEALRGFLDERHLATLVTLRADGSPHAVPVGFTRLETDDGLVLRVITFAGSVKAANAARRGRAAIMQADGGRWVTFEGTVELQSDDASVAGAVAAYAARYRPPKERVDRVVVAVRIDRVMCSASLR